MEEIFRVQTFPYAGQHVIVEADGWPVHGGDFELNPWVLISDDLHERTKDVKIDIEALPDVGDLFDNFDRKCIGRCYFAIAPICGKVKIGFTTDMAQRRASLSTSSPEKLFFFDMPGYPQIERLLHKIFRPVRSHLEWHDAHPALLTYISETWC